MSGKAFSYIRAAAIALCAWVVTWTGGPRTAGSPAPGEQALRVTRDPSVVRVSDGGREILEYRHGGVRFKPYVRRLSTPKGVNILRDAPADHKHHHGLMLAIGIDGVDFWSELVASVPGRQRARLTVDAVEGLGGMPGAGFSQQVDWLEMRDDKVLMVERRDILVSSAREDGATLVTWSSRFRLPEGKSSAEIWGRHYFGLGMRFVSSMDKEGKFLNADGKPGEVVRGTERLARSSWCAYRSEVEGRRVTVAMFDHPGNLRHPATWFTMTGPFAYLSATLNLHREGITMKSERPLELRYGVALWDGHTEAAQIEKLYRKWVGRSRQGAAPSGGGKERS